MNIKTSGHITFETREIKQLYIIRRQNETFSCALTEIQNGSLSFERRGEFKAPWREKLRGFWKRGLRPLKDKVQKNEVLLQEIREDK